MANVDRVNGFRPVMHLSGAPYNGARTAYAVASGDSTALFVGDLVKLAGSADSEGRRTVAQAAAGNACIGVVVGFDIDPTNLDTPQYRAASTARVVYVADDPSLIFEAQADDALAADDHGLNVNFVVGSGSTTTGASGMEVDSSTKATTATLPLKFVGWVRRQDNETNAANNKVLVSINNHQLGSHTGTAGV